MQKIFLNQENMNMEFTNGMAFVFIMYLVIVCFFIIFAWTNERKDKNK